MRLIGCRILKWRRLRPKFLPTLAICCVSTNNIFRDRRASRFSNARSSAASTKCRCTETEGGHVMPFAAALSTAETTLQAVEEVCEQARAHLSGDADLAVLFFSTHHTRA